MPPPPSIDYLVTRVFLERLEDVPSPSMSKSFIGIIVAICGNILISLALNCQKLAHWRLEREHAATRGHSEAKNDPRIPEGVANGDNSISDVNESASLLNESLRGRPASYGVTCSTSQGSKSMHFQVKSKPVPPKLTSRPSSSSIRNGTPTFTEERSVSLAAAQVSSSKSSSSLIPPPPGDNASDAGNNDDEGGEREEGDYLKSKLWWFGFALMNVGEIGNFLSYGFAPASVVAPLGAFALIANCFFAPLMLHERFRRIDLLGMLLAIFGASTIVASAQMSSPHLNPDQLLEALQELAFVVYTCTIVALAALLGYASERKWGKEWIVVDVGLCALFGGFTVLCTKAVSSLLTLEWFDIFGEWLTYPLLVVLLGSGIGQIKYLNRALKRFDSKQVIPTQFVFFNLSAIIGSAILYGDFRRVSFHQFITFLYGCAATFGGVYFLTAGSRNHGSNAEETNISTARFERLAAIPEEASSSESRPNPHPIRVLGKRRSTTGVGLSPGQYLLLAAPITPIRSTTSTPKRHRSLERECRDSPTSLQRSPERVERGRALSLGQRRE